VAGGGVVPFRREPGSEFVTKSGRRVERKSSKSPSMLWVLVGVCLVHRHDVVVVELEALRAGDL